MKPKRLVIVRFRQTRQKWEVDHPSLSATGPRRLRPTFGSELEAQAYAAKVAQALTDGVPIVADRDILLKDYAPKWLEARRPDISARTARSYTQSLDHYVLPRLGTLRVREIRPRHLLPWLTSLKQRGLAPDTIRLARAALSALMTRAVLEEITDTNPVVHLGHEKGAQPGKLTKAEREAKVRPFASVAQRDAFLKVTAAPKYRPYGMAWEVMAKAGLRPSEAYALQPHHLDLKASTLRVEQALDLRVRGCADRAVRPTKTYEQRVVRLSSGLADSLKRHLFWLREETLRRGWGEAKWLFPSDHNTALDESKATKAFHRALKEAGLPHHVPYDCRHTFVCLMLTNGARLGYVSKQIGHKNVATTLRHYYRWLQDDEGDQRQADLLEPNPGTKTTERRVSAGAGGGT